MWKICKAIRKVENTLVGSKENNSSFVTFVVVASLNKLPKHIREKTTGPKRMAKCCSSFVFLAGQKKLTTWYRKHW